MQVLDGGGQILLKDVVIYANSDILYAIDAITGKRRWQVWTQNSVPPVVSNDRVYVIGLGYSISVLDVSTGALLWGKKI